MFTVVIAEKELIDSIQEYNIFLKPFIDAENVAFCKWNTEGVTLEEAVPALVGAVGREMHWRAVVVCDEKGLNQKNPFELVHYQPPKVNKEDYEDEYFEGVRTAKVNAFESAAKLPLTRLMTYFCDSPMITSGKNSYGEQNKEFAEYLYEAEYKQKLRREILGEEKFSIALPTEIYCVAKRTYQKQEYDINTSWTPHVDHQYTRFYDWNLYFDKMRYLVFDVLPKDNQNYTFDYIRFLYALLLFASNEVPLGCLRPNRVYCMNCENDERELRRLIVSYDEKLHNTESTIEEEIEVLTHKQKVRLTDSEVAALFCSSVTVPVTLDPDFEVLGLFADRDQIGLSSDCPKNEENFWENTFLRSEKTLFKLIKQPRRSVKKGVDNLHDLSEADCDSVKLLNPYQMEDVQEYVDMSELTMVDVPTTDLYDVERYQKMMKEADKVVRNKIATRMTRATTLILGAVMLFAYFLGFLPLVINNRKEADPFLNSWILTGCAMGLLLVTGGVCLFCLRHALRKCMGFFNETMGDIKGEIDNSLLQFSKYLTQACNMMRGNSVINYFHEHEDKDVLQVRIRKKHLDDIQRHRVELRDIFGSYLTDTSLVDEHLAEAYLYNFSRTVDFPYPIPFTEGEKRQIEFMQPGSSITVPVDFVKRITVRLEELYD